MEQDRLQAVHAVCFLLTAATFLCGEWGWGLTLLVAWAAVAWATSADAAAPQHHGRSRRRRCVCGRGWRR